ncbi:hypothetical protein BH24ACT8_BH24ACT8_17340 [soil metagenome]
MRLFLLPRSAPALIVLGALTACGGEADTPDAGAPTTPAPTESTVAETSSEPVPASSEESSSADDGQGAEADTEDPGGGGAAPGVGDACALLDTRVLDTVMEGSTTMLGTPFEFAEPIQESPSEFCSWKETNTGLWLQLTLEPAAISAVDDHSGRAYNIDVEPTPVAQDGPGSDAVLLIDTAFDEVGGEGFAYGYFFVAGEVTVFVESVGLDLGEDGLRALADEAASRLETS